MFEVRHGRHDGHGGSTSDTFDTFHEAKSFADWIREDWDMNVYWVEFNDIAMFALAVEQAARPNCTQCGGSTDPIWHRESGGLCGICLADYALPLTVIS